MSNSTNLAAEFFVASQLYRLGYTVTLTLGNTKEVDLIVAHLDGRTITIDTKGLKNTTNWPVAPKLIRDTHFFILVSYINHFQSLDHHPEVFIIPSTKGCYYQLVGQTRYYLCRILKSAQQHLQECMASFIQRNRLTNRCSQRGKAVPVPLRGSRLLVPRG